MKLANLDNKIIEALKPKLFDLFIEKHDIVWSWGDFFDSVDFIELNGYQVLLPIEEDRRPNVSVLRCIESKDEKTLTLFLRDTTYIEQPYREWAWTGFVAVCDKFEDQDFYVATVYHEWFILDEVPKR